MVLAKLVPAADLEDTPGLESGVIRCETLTEASQLVESWVGAGRSVFCFWGWRHPVVERASLGSVLGQSSDMYIELADGQSLVPAPDEPDEDEEPEDDHEQ